jgi:glycerophosphoryl diester phosphodiesterase
MSSKRSDARVLTTTPVGCQRIGHGGASAIERANTLASFDAARAVGVDVIEFDVRGFRGDLVLAHTRLHAHYGTNVRLREALRHLAGAAFDGIELHLDVKHTGCERSVLDALSAHGLTARTTICSQVPAVLDGFRARSDELRVGISVGGRLARLSQRWTDWRTNVIHGLATRRWDALFAQHRLVDSELVAAVSGSGGSLYAWTVNDRTRIEALKGLGVDGITTADPRLFR